MKKTSIKKYCKHCGKELRKKQKQYCSYECWNTAYKERKKSTFSYGEIWVLSDNMKWIKVVR